MDGNNGNGEGNNLEPPPDWQQEFRRRMIEIIEQKEWFIAYLEELFQVGVEQGPNGEAPARTS